MVHAIRAAMFAVLIWTASPALAQETAPQDTAPDAAPPGPAEGLSAEQAEALVTLLRDPTAREAVVAELQRIAGAAPEAAPEAAAPEPSAPVAISRRIARATQEIAQDVTVQANRLWFQLRAVPRVLSSVGPAEIGVILLALQDLALVILATAAIVLILRRLATPVFRRIGSGAEQAGLARQLAAILAGTAVDALVVILAWAVGYAIAIMAIGAFGEIAIRQSLYLNAFLIVEMARLAIRAALSPSTAALRLVALPDILARKLSARLGLVASILGYGLPLVVPIVNQNASYLAGRGVSALVILAAILLLAGLAIGNRRAVSRWLSGDDGTPRTFGVPGWLARNWHLPVTAYLAVILLLTLTRTGGVLVAVLSASGQVLAAVLLGAFAVGQISRSIVRGVRVPRNVALRLPPLETRLNAFVPRILFLLRGLLILGILAFALHTVGLVDIRLWLESSVGVAVTGRALSVAMILLGAFLVWLAFSSWIDYRLDPDRGKPPSARERTLFILLKSAGNVVLVVITLMFALSEVGIDIAPLIASAGVLGLAIGFGAQKMVQDIITGVFIQLENAMNVGDVMGVNGTSGVVERLTIRSVSLRDIEGAFHIIPFSSVDMVTNHMREFGNHVCDMGIAYRESIPEAKAAMFEAHDHLRADPQWGAAVIGDLEWFGVQALADSAVVLRARIKCRPGLQWGVGRAYNERVKQAFDARDIEIPFPHQTVYFGTDKAGHAPPVHVVADPAPAESSPEPSPALPHREG